MMKIVAVALPAAWLACALANPAAAEGKKVTVTGCPYPGVEAGCLMIKDKDGTVYNITGANPKPQPNDVAIIATGTVAQKLSICNQGTVLDDIKWDRTKMRCPQ
jgi:hypothetical protein